MLEFMFREQIVHGKQVNNTLMYSASQKTQQVQQVTRAISIPVTRIPEKKRSILSFSMASKYLIGKMLLTLTKTLTN